MHAEIERRHQELSKHPLYTSLSTLENVKTFMKYHAFAVWDFMSLLKSLQREITTVSHPWQESSYSPMMVRLINDIVLGEESDLDQHGESTSHFSLYLKAMEEIGADTNPIKDFVKYGDFSKLPKEVANIVQYHLSLAESGTPHQVASSFFFGREKLIPTLFDSLVKATEEIHHECPTFLYYLERHIEVDSEDHGPKALQCLDQLTDNQSKKEEALSVAKDSLDHRTRLWDFILSEIDS